MAPTFKDVYGSKYLLLTTFTKDGRPKPTTVWGVPEGDKLLVITDDEGEAQEQSAEGEQRPVVGDAASPASPGGHAEDLVEAVLDLDHHRDRGVDDRNRSLPARVG